MKVSKIITTALFLIITSYSLVNAQVGKDESNNQGDVMGTSVVVNAPENILDIKRIDTPNITQGENAIAKIYLENLVNYDEQIDEVKVTVKKLNGEIKLSKNIKVAKNIKPSEETDFSIEIPNSLESGEYVGIFELYTRDVALGSSKTVISVQANTPEVLGASIENYDYLLLPVMAAFAGVFAVSLILLIKKKSLLSKGISIKLFDVIVVIVSLSVFGLGVCGGYFLCKLFFPRMPLDKMQEVDSSDNDISDISSEDGYDINFVYDNNSLSVYAKPGSSSGIAFELKENAKLKIIDETAGWYRVLLENGSNGWVEISDFQDLINNGK